jgi:hypothetical protein
MAHWPQQFRRALGLTAALLSLLLVQDALGFSFGQTSANLSPRTVYRNLDSLVSVVLSGSSHIVGNLQTLYELRQLALRDSQPEGSSVAISPRSRFSTAAQSVLCSFPVVPAPSRTDHRCPLSRRG